MMPTPGLGGVLYGTSSFQSKVYFFSVTGEVPIFHHCSKFVVTRRWIAHIHIVVMRASVAIDRRRCEQLILGEISKRVGAV